MLNVLDYGAKADGTTDDAAAFQAAIDAAAARGGSAVLVPVGDYLLRSGLRITNADQISPITLVGENFASRLIFDRPPTGEAFAEAIRLDNATGCGVRDLELVSSSARGFTHAVHVTSSDTAIKPGSTQWVTLSGLLIDGFPNGIAIGADTISDVSEVTVRECLSGNCSGSAFVVGNGINGNVVNARFYSCVAQTSTNGVYAAGSTFAWIGGTAQHNAWDFVQGGPTTAPLLIFGVRSELSGGFFRWQWGGQWAMPAAIRSCYVAGWTGPVLIQHENECPLTIEECVFGMASTPAVIQSSGGAPLILRNVGHNNPGQFIVGGGTHSMLNVYQVDNATGSPIAGTAVSTQPPCTRARQQATIPAGQSTIVVPHGLGAIPAIEDVGCVSLGNVPIWLTGVNEAELTFRTSALSGASFIWSASLR